MRINLSRFPKPLASLVLLAAPFGCGASDSPSATPSAAPGNVAASPAAPAPAPEDLTAPPVVAGPVEAAPSAFPALPSTAATEAPPTLEPPTSPDQAASELGRDVRQASGAVEGSLGEAKDGVQRAVG